MSKNNIIQEVYEGITDFNRAKYIMEFLLNRLHTNGSLELMDLQDAEYSYINITKRNTERYNHVT
jgi:hypothetical protein